MTLRSASGFACFVTTGRQLKTEDPSRAWKEKSIICFVFGRPPDNRVEFAEGGDIIVHDRRTRHYVTSDVQTAFSKRSKQEKCKQ